MTESKLGAETQLIFNHSTSARPKHPPLTLLEGWWTNAEAVASLNTVVKGLQARFVCDVDNLQLVCHLLVLSSSVSSVMLSKCQSHARFRA